MYANRGEKMGHTVLTILAGGPSRILWNQVLQHLSGSLAGRQASDVLGRCLWANGASDHLLWRDSDLHRFFARSRLDLLRFR